MTSPQAGPPTGTAPDVSPENQTLLARVGNTASAFLKKARNFCYHLGIVALAFGAIGLVFSAIDANLNDWRATAATFKGVGNFVATIGDKEPGTPDEKKVAGKFNFAAQAEAQDKKPASVSADPIIPAVSKDSNVPVYVKTTFAKMIEFFGGKYEIGKNYTDRSDPYAVWEEAKTHTLQLRDKSWPLRNLIKWNTTQWTNEMQKELALHLKEALNDIGVPINYLWDEGVAGTKTITNLAARVTSINGMVKENESRLKGVVYDSYGVEKLDLLFEVDELQRTVRILDGADPTKELKLRAWYDPHAAFFGRAHKASRGVVLVTGRDRHYCTWVMDIGAIAPTAGGTNVMWFHVQNNTPTKCYLDKTGTARLLAQATKMTDRQIAALVSW